MKCETSSLYPFYPTYVYEPYTTQFDVLNMKDNLYFVDSTSMGSGGSVPSHLNVKDFSYPLTPQTVWDIVKKYSQIVEYPSPGGVVKYGSRKRKGQVGTNKDSSMWFYDIYSAPQKIYDDFLGVLWKKLQVDNDEKRVKAYAQARDSLATYLRDKWNGGVTGAIAGLKNIPAQTRIASSYGLLQILYTTAGGRGFNKKSLPEYLNVTDTSMTYSISALLKYINDVLKKEKNHLGNWSNGLEGLFKNKVWFPKWNKKRNYGSKVLESIKNYLPQ